MPKPGLRGPVFLFRYKAVAQRQGTNQIVGQKRKAGGLSEFGQGAGFGGECPLRLLQFLQRTLSILVHRREIGARKE